MDKLNVYLSSPYMEFKQIRDQFLTEIKSRNKLYDITAMENYLAIDKDVLTTCINDVNNCNIYVLVLGDKYGSIAKKNDSKVARSFTYWEFDASNKKKNSGKEIERLILLKSGPAAANEDPLLTAWKKEIAESQIQTVYYNNQEDIPQKILDCLDNFTLQRIQGLIQKKDVLRDKIFLCDRQQINLQFSVSLTDDPVQFFVLNGHQNDLPHYFVKRQEIEYEDREQNWKNINIKPLIPETIIQFEKAELYIKSAIFNELKWKKFLSPKDITPQGIIEYMTEKNIDYFSISWFIESVLWKNDALKEFIVSFYKKNNEANSKLKTNKRILFFGILRFVPNDNITESQFYERIKSIQWGNNLLKFSKINKQDIKDWLNNNEIEDIEMRCEELISLYLKDIAMGDMYYQQVEAGLQKMLDLYHQ